MRPTLHEYNLQKLSDLDCTAISDVLNFTKLTNRSPRLGDFVACDEDENVLEEPDLWQKHLLAKAVNGDISKDKYTEYQAAQSRTIFKGDWEVIDQDNDWTQIRSKELKLDVEWSGNECDVTVWDSNWNTCDYLSANRIEDLPREIEFKDGVL